MRVKASSPSGQYLFDLASRIARGTNPHLWFDNHFTPSELDGRRPILQALDVSAALEELKEEMDQALGASVFVEALI